MILPRYVDLTDEQVPSAPLDVNRFDPGAGLTAWPGSAESAGACNSILAGPWTRSNHTDKVEDNTLGISIEKDLTLSNTLPNDNTPGGRIRHARLQRDMLIVDLAATTGMSVVSIRLAEQNKTTVSPPNLRKLSEALGVSIACLGCFENLPEETLGQRIKKARLFHGYTKRGFGDIFGLSARMILGWETDEFLPIEKHWHTLTKYLQILER